MGTPGGGTEAPTVEREREGSVPVYSQLRLGDIYSLTVRPYFLHLIPSLPPPFFFPDYPRGFAFCHTDTPT